MPRYKNLPPLTGRQDQGHTNLSHHLNVKERENAMKQWIATALLLPAAVFGAEHSAPVPLPVHKVTMVVDHHSRQYPGRVTAVAKVNITSSVSGELQKVGFHNGAIVKAGDLLFLINPVKYEAAVKNAKAQVTECKAKLEYAESNYRRNKQLSAAKAVSTDVLENSVSTRNVTAAALDAAEAALIAAQDDLKHCRITAPISGKIGSAEFTEGNYITPNSGTLAVLVQTDPIRVRFSISSRDFLSVFNGKSSRITADGIVRLILSDGRLYPIEGKVEYVENIMDENTDTVIVYALFPNRERILRPGGTVRVELSSRRGAEVPAIPLSAVMQDAKGTFVWLVKSDNSVEKRYIQRGTMRKDSLLVRSGLSAGETVVSDGTHKVRNGDRIVPVHP